MTQKAETLYAEVLSLADAEREEFVIRLLECLDHSEDADAETAWGDEIKTRLDDVRAGRVTPVAWEEARKQILADDDLCDELDCRAEELRRDPSLGVPWEQVRDMR